jgi:hypothetical protein
MLVPLRGAPTMNIGRSIFICIWRAPLSEIAAQSDHNPMFPISWLGKSPWIMVFKKYDNTLLAHICNIWVE